ncbi:MAG: hypothetical protein HQK87_08700 [Nitrospinae bacterium]|nr:hypothetical protein [Nitrospinota bacterium]
MRDFTSRFAAGMGLMAFGVAGFVALSSGAQAMTALTRGVLAGGAFLLLGLLVATIWYDGPAKTPVPPIPLKPHEKSEGK